LDLRKKRGVANLAWRKKPTPNSFVHVNNQSRHRPWKHFWSLISPISVLASLGAGMESKHDKNLYTPSLQLGATKWHHRCFWYHVWCHFYHLPFKLGSFSNKDSTQITWVENWRRLIVVVNYYMGTLHILCCIWHHNVA
jgi:hypothetical protein